MILLLQCPGDVEGQAKQVYQTLIALLQEMGGESYRIDRIRLHLKNPADAAIVWEVHRSLIGTTTVGVTVIAGCDFVLPGALVQIEAEGVFES